MSARAFGGPLPTKPLELIGEDSGRIDFALYVDRERVSANKYLCVAENLDLLSMLRDDHPAAVYIEESVYTVDFGRADRRLDEQDSPIAITGPTVSGQPGEHL